MNMKKQQGFTLVEIAIVLVIIGLLLGGALKGQEMIKSAKVKSQMQQMDAISAAYNTYLDKFGVVPGDDAAADTNTGVAGIANGDGNSSYSAVEGNQRIWQHLQAANLLAGYTAAVGGSYIGAFLNKYGQPTIVRTNGWGFSGSSFCTNVPNNVAQEIDRKIDNGSGATGAYRSSGSVAYPTAAGNSWLCSSL
jgi:prepilin-type N-terminal cleavage/methylation domain-containing protein